eukprot:g9036.t1
MPLDIQSDKKKETGAKHDEDEHTKASLKCLATLTRLINGGSLWWSFQHWAEILPSRESLQKTTQRALMERQTLEILKTTKPGERTDEQLKYIQTFLKQCAKQFFSNVSESDIMLLCQHSELDYMKTGRRILFEQGDLGDYFYIVIRGRVLIYVSDWDISHLDKKTKERNPSLLGTNVAEIGVGGTFGEIAMTHRSGKRMASALAVFGTGLLRVDADTYNNALKESRANAKKFENSLMFLGKLSCFHGFTRLRLVHIAYEMKSRDMAFGRTVQRQGRLANGLYMITSGQVSVTSVCDTSRIRVGTWSSPRILGLRTLFYVHNKRRKGGVQYGKEKFEINVSSTHLNVIFLPFTKFEDFLERLKGTTALSTFADMIQLEEEELKQKIEVHNHAVNILHKNDVPGLIQQSYLEDTNHGRIKKTSIQFPSPVKKDIYDPKKYKREFATISQVDAIISVGDASQKLKEEAQALPSFSSLLLKAKQKEEEILRRRMENIIIGPPGMNRSAYDKERSKYLRHKRCRWLKSANLKEKKKKWRKDFRKLATDEFDIGRNTGRTLYDSHGRVIAQMKS